MKYKGLILLLALACNNLTAQTITSYQFNANSGAFTPLSGGTTLPFSGGNSNDGWFNGVPIGFTFYYMGEEYNTISASTKGWFSFGGNLSAATDINNLTSGGVRPLAAPLWDDHDIQSASNFSYTTTGTEPSRVFTAEWKDVKWRYFASSGGISFQVKLYEGSGKVEFIYQQEPGALTTSPSASIGIAASSTGSGNFLSLNSSGSSPTVSSTTETTTINTKPATGQVYTFTPQSTSPAAPVSLTFTDVSKTGMTIEWTDNSTTETFFRLYASQDGISYSLLNTQASTTTATTGTAYSYVYSGLLPGITYYYRVSACNEGTAPSAWLSGSQATTAPEEITSVASGNWNNSATWSGSAVPSSLDNVTIADGTTVTIDAAATCNALTVGQGTSGILRYGTTLTNLTVSQGVAVAAGGLFDAGAPAGTNLSHTLYLGGASATSMGTGSLTVNGTFDMYIGSSNGKCTVTFFGIPDATVNGSGTIDFYRVILNKGNTNSSAPVIPPVLEILIPCLGSGLSTTGFIYTTFTAGTVKIGGTSNWSSPVFTSASYSIPLKGGLWLDNPNFTLSGLAGSPTNNGLVKLSAGVYNIGTGTGHSIGAGANATFLIENGTLNVAGRLNTANAVTYQQTGGTVNITTVGNISSNTPGFGITNTSSSFMMTGGTINLVKANTGSTKIDYSMLAGTVAISGGTLNLGSTLSGASQTFYLRGTAPNIVMTNTGGNHSATLANALTVMGDLTLNGTGTFANNGYSLTMEGMNVSAPGHLTVSSGASLTFTGAASNLSFTGTAGNQTFSNSGTITSGQIPGLVINNTFGGAGTVTIPGGLTMLGDATLNLTTGTLNTGSGLTLGTGAATGFTFAGGNGSITGPVSFNFGSGNVNYTYSGTSAQVTGAELPSTISGTLTISNTAGVTLNTPLTAGKLTLNNGTLTTTSANLLTISGTATGDLTYTAGQVNGPLARTLPASLVSGSTYLFPLGKSAYRPLELVNPETNAGGTVVVRAEVFDTPSGGTPGATMNTLNTNRYWNAEVISGGANFTSAAIRLTETGLDGNSGIAKSSAQTGVYELVSLTAPSGNTLITGTMTGLSYYVTGEKKMNYVSSTVTQTNSNILREGSVNQEIIGIQVVTSGSIDPALLTSFTFSTSGSTNPGDIVSAGVFFTGTSATFATTTPFGSTFTNPSGLFVINGSQTLTEGNNYFWLVYDIGVGIADGNVADAECTSVTVRSVSNTPTVQAPAGNRVIRAALTGTVTVGSGGQYPSLTGAGGLFEKIGQVGLKGNLTAQVISDITETGTNALTAWYEAGGTGFSMTIVPDATVLRTLSGSYAGGLIRLNKVTGVSIDGRSGGSGKYLAIQNTAASGSIAAVQLIGTSALQGCTNVTIRNCRISAGHTASNSCGIALGGNTPASAGYDHDQITIQDCNISKAWYGIYAGGNSSGKLDDLIISGDSIGSVTSGSEITKYGIYTVQCDNALIIQNQVFNLKNSSGSPIGIALASGTMNSEVSRNRVNGLRYAGTSSYGATGILISPGFISANISVLNNQVCDILGAGSSSLSSDGIAGIKVLYGSNVQLYYNSVNLSGNVSRAVSGDKSAAFYIIGGTPPMNIILKNNILRNSIVNTAASATAYAIYSDMDKFGFALIDYNDYYAEGAQSRLGYINYNTATNITGWRSYTSQDVHSLGEDPLFSSVDNLRIDHSSPCRSAADPVAEITIDYEGVTRNATNPTMGALETTADVKGPVISYTPLGNTALLTARSLTATLTDSTGVPVAGSGLPVLYWNINRGSWNSATGSHLSGDEYQFSFGSGVVTGDSVFYFIAAQDTKSTPDVSVYPSQGASGFSANPPSCTVKPIYPSAYRILTGLAGTITVGSGGDYPTLTGTGGLFQMVNDNLLTANLTVSVTSDLTESGTHALNAWEEEGSGNYTLTIQPDGTTERLITGNATPALIRLDGADRVTINGSVSDTTSRYLRIRNTHSSSPVIQFLNGARYNVISNCHLESGLSGNGVVSFATSTDLNGNSNNQILRNAIHDRTDAAGTPVYCIYSSGTSGKVNKANILRGNEIYNFTAYGINITATGNGGDWQILDNHFYNTMSTPPASLQRGIHFLPGNLSFGNHITGNFIGGNSPSCGGSLWQNNGTSEFAGIYINSGFASNVVRENTISNISLINESCDGFSGIRIEEGSCQVTGNVIGSNDPLHSIRVASTDGWIYGINHQSSNYCNISGNTLTNLMITASSGYPVIYGVFAYGADIIQNTISGIGSCTNAVVVPEIYGIYHEGWSGLNTEFFNNSIALDGGASLEPTIYGFYDFSYEENEYEFHYNSVSISGPATTYAVTYAFYRAIGSVFNMNNNVLANFREAGFLGNIYSVFLVTEGDLVSDFNDLYCPAGILVQSGNFSSFGLPDWQAYSGNDIYSISSDPLFTDNTDDLLPASGSPLLFNGVPLQEVQEDIRDTIRDPGATTIGCYESGTFTTRVWNGSVSANWHDAANWTPPVVPGPADNIAITTLTPNACTVTSQGMQCNTLVVGHEGALNLNSAANLTILGNLHILPGGTLTNQGTIILKGNLRNLNE